MQDFVHSFLRLSWIPIGPALCLIDNYPQYGWRNMKENALYWNRLSNADGTGSRGPPLAVYNSDHLITHLYPNTFSSDPHAEFLNSLPSSTYQAQQTLAANVRRAQGGTAQGQTAFLCFTKVVSYIPSSVSFSKMRQLGAPCITPHMDPPSLTHPWAALPTALTDGGHEERRLDSWLSPHSPVHWQTKVQPASLVPANYWTVYRVLDLGGTR